MKRETTSSSHELNQRKTIEDGIRVTGDTHYVFAESILGYDIMCNGTIACLLWETSGCCASETFQHDMWKEMKATAGKRRLVHLGHKVSILALVTYCPMALEEVVRREQVHYPRLLPAKCSCHTVPCPTVEKTANVSPAVKAIVSEKWQTFWRGIKRLGYRRSEAIDNDVQEALDQRWAQGRSDCLLCCVSCAPCLAGLCVVCCCGYGAVGRCGSDIDGVDGHAENHGFIAWVVRTSKIRARK